MPDRDEIIKALECCTDRQYRADCYGCYQKGPGFGLVCRDNLMRDALALLKEQDALVPGRDSGMCEICSFYERALPVKPHYNARTNWYECGACHYSMTSGMHCRGELIPAYKVGFCAKCGRKQEWE